MINQFLFLIFLFLLGYNALLFFKEKIDHIHRLLLSAPMGAALWVLFFLLLRITSIPSCKSIILGLSFLLLAGSILWNLYQKRYTKGENRLLLLFLGGLSAVIWVFLLVNFTFCSNDSWLLIDGGRQIGFHWPLSDDILSSRGIFAVILNSSGSYFGFPYLYALYPLFTLLAVVFLVRNLFWFLRGRDNNSIQRMIFVSLAALLILSSYFILFNAFYIHTNLMFGIYVFIALLSLWKGLLDRKNEWLYISCLALLAACFLRIEGPLLALVVIVIVLSQESLKSVMKWAYFLPVFLFVLAWQVRMYLRLHDYQDEKFDKNLILLIIGAYILVLIGSLLLQIKQIRWMNRYLPLFLVFFLSVLWTYSLFSLGLRVKWEDIVIRRYENIPVNLLKEGMWGVLWVALGLIFIAALFLKKVKLESVFIYYLACFLLFFNSVNLYRGGWRIGWGDSGNRMFIHIVLIVVFYAFLKLGNALFLQRAGKDA